MNRLLLELRASLNNGPGSKHCILSLQQSKSMPTLLFASWGDAHRDRIETETHL